MIIQPKLISHELIVSCFMCWKNLSTYFVYVNCGLHFVNKLIFEYQTVDLVFRWQIIKIQFIERSQTLDNNETEPQIMFF